jgi:predicted DNA-binding protein (MmcQ/YjbR family)
MPLGTEPVGSGIVMITGRYRLPSDVVSELKQALADNPDIVVLDLHGVSGNSKLLSEVLDPVGDYLAAWPGTVVAVCVPDPVRSAPLVPSMLSDRVLLAGSHMDALERARHAVPHQDRTSTFLTPEPQASAVARAFTRRTLRQWQMDGLVWPASLVVSELVTHSILEAQTVLDLTLCRVDHRIRVAVHDYGADNFRIPRSRTPADPLEDTPLGRWLLVVGELTRCWGVFPSRVHGKTVWSVLEGDRSETASPAPYVEPMDADAMRAYCLAKPGAWPDWPWGGGPEDPLAEGHEHPVVKVGPEGAGKIFAFLDDGGVGVKGGPTREVADEWLQRYPEDASVMAYIGRSGWNDLSFSGTIPDDELQDAVDESYRLVVSKLPKRLRPPGWDDSS